MSKFCFVRILCVSLALCATACVQETRLGDLNDSLRLTAGQVATYKAAAQRGDVEAAHKLWLHYEFGVYDFPKADFWKKKYDALRKSNHQT